MIKRGENWVFLGDSLTEGVGSSRISHVTELVTQLRSDTPQVDGRRVHEMRLRRVNPREFNQFIEFNLGGYFNVDSHGFPLLCVWNLACEGQTIDSDFAWLPLIAALRPELVVIFRGSLESIVRPAMIADGDWPWWVPQSWRGYAAMDPRCYFSTTWWRKAKQTSIDLLKQRVRLKLLQARPGKPLMDLEDLASHQTQLIRQLQSLGTQILVLGLLPVNEQCFPGSAAHFRMVNKRLQQVAQSEGVKFCDWASSLNGNDLFYRDGFHPNANGAAALAQILREQLCQESVA